ncbi:MAG: TIGR00730 family Rossman fold protein [Bacteroidota bacterium]
MIKKNICVYCSSSNLLDDIYYLEARLLGQLMAKQGYGLVYGGGNVGLMGVIAKAVHESDGYVYGVIPQALKDREGVAYEIADELVVTDSLRERKALMFDKSQAFITLPGGIGTLEELLETLTLKQLGYHNAPMVIVNTDGFYNSLLALLSELLEKRFVKASFPELFTVVENVREAMVYINSTFEPISTDGSA